MSNLCWGQHYFSDTEVITGMLEDIERDIAELTLNVDVGFYKQKYEDDMQIVE